MAEPSPPDKTVLLAKLLYEHGRLCVWCLCEKSGFAVRDIAPTTRRLDETFTVAHEMGRCSACERWTLVYSLSVGL